MSFKSKSGTASSIIRSKTPIIMKLGILNESRTVIMS